ncbi:MAG: hypothetical protein H6Q55_144 [Deltaproteobacteria bacterium]|jgi:hypothetical protein|nr:hypothetical protein [Deltaproteobacteria bacterium]
MILDEVVFHLKTYFDEGAGQKMELASDPKQRLKDGQATLGI